MKFLSVEFENQLWDFHAPIIDFKKLKKVLCIHSNAFIHQVTHHSLVDNGGLFSKIDVNSTLI